MLHFQYRSNENYHWCIRTRSSHSSLIKNIIILHRNVSKQKLRMKSVRENHTDVFAKLKVLLM